MAEKYLFFGSTPDDRRKHSASDMAIYWESFLSTGVIDMDKEPLLHVTADGQEQKVTLSVGRALIKGHLYINTEPLEKEVYLSTSEEDRYDRLVLRFDNTVESRFIKSFVKQGDETGPPELTRTNVIHEISLAQIHVKAGKSFVEQSDITDERLDEELCGLASSLVSVPTDVFTNEWKEFVAEYNKWFAEIQGSAFATVDDVRESENNMKREIANLNLQLEANKRVKNGVTFGTNFADSFGMEIDMSRTSSDDALEIGQTVINVRDASDFKVGTEVTIFDDENLERVNISSINGNDITLETALAKEYKEGVNIARSMLIQKSLNRYAEFGAWGTYEYRSIDLNFTDIRNSNDARSNLALARLQDRFFISYNLTVSCIDENLTEHKLIEFSHTSSNARVLTIGKYVYVVYVPDSGHLYEVRVFNYDMEEVFSLSEIDALSNPEIGVSYNEETNEFCVSAKGQQGDVILDVYIYKKDGSLEKRGRYSYTDAGLRFYGFNPLVVTGSHYYFFQVKRISGSGTGTEYGTVITKIDRSLTGHETIVVGDYSVGVTSGTELYVNRLLDGSYLAFSRTRCYRSVDLETWELKHTASPAGGMLAFFVDDYSNAYALGSDGKVRKCNFIEETEYELVYTPGTTNVTTGYARSFSLEFEIEEGTPFYFFGNSSYAGIRGEGVIGYGAEITTNDIRFKTKPSKEVVTWLQHDEGLTVTEATFGNINLDLSTLDDETQAVGYTTKEQSEVRLTIERPSIYDDVKITRMLGGTS